MEEGERNNTGIDPEQKVGYLKDLPTGLWEWKDIERFADRVVGIEAC